MLTLQSYITGVKSGEINALETIKKYQEKVKANELNAWISQTPEYVNEHAEDFLSKALCAAPIGVKDLIMTKGVKSTCGSKMLENYIPEFSATCFQKLEEAGGLLIGKNNLDEFAMGGSGEHSAFWATLNPRDHTRIAGGSSSGSAASVANDECLASIGTDTGGSVRLPAAFCGIVGFKPSYGMISRYGVQSMSNSLDQVGTLTKTVEDAKILFNALKGYDPLDMNSIENQKPIDGSIKKLRVCSLHSFYEQGIDPQIKEKTLSYLEGLKADSHIEGIDFIDFDLLQYLIAIYYIIMPAESSTNLSRFDGIKHGLQEDTTQFDSLSDYYKDIRNKWFGEEVKRRLLVGSYVLSSGFADQYYNKALMVRDMIKGEFMKIFEKYDIIIWPTSPVRPWTIGGHNNNPVADYLADMYTVPANLIGAPAMSLPMWFGEVEGKKLPLGIHIMAKPHDDQAIFQMGAIIEEYTARQQI